MKNMQRLNCFGTYDIRGLVDRDFNENLAFRIGWSVATYLKAKKITIGFDKRETSKDLAEATILGCIEAGADVYRLGMVGTEQMYHSVNQFGFCSGIQITASHNSYAYNGMKIVKNFSEPLDQWELKKVEFLSLNYKSEACRNIGNVFDLEKLALEAYLRKIISLVSFNKLKPMSILFSFGCSPADGVIKKLQKIMELKGIETNFNFLSQQIYVQNYSNHFDQFKKEIKLDA